MIELATNEFTAFEILRYVQAAFGSTVSGGQLTSSLVNRWMQLGTVPQAYGGHKLISKRLCKEFNLPIYSLQGLERTILEDLEVYTTKAPKPLPKAHRPKKQRTELYWNILKEKGGKRSLPRKTTKELATLPDDKRLAGIKGNQVIRSRKRKIKA